MLNIISLWNYNIYKTGCYIHLNVLSFFFCSQFNEFILKLCYFFNGLFPKRGYSIEASFNKRCVYQYTFNTPFFLNIYFKHTHGLRSKSIKASVTGHHPAFHFITIVLLVAVCLKITCPSKTYYPFKKNVESESFFLSVCCPSVMSLKPVFEWSQLQLSCKFTTVGM